MNSKLLPRGLRNNNPFNIKRSSHSWYGKTEFPTSVLGISKDPTFEQFCTLEYGVRAGLKLLYNYIYLYGLDTVYKILERFAPRSENALDAYVDYVESNIQLDSTFPCFKKCGKVTGNRLLFFQMCSAIIKYENGIGTNTLTNFKLTPSDLSETFDKFFPNYNFNDY